MLSTLLYIYLAGIPVTIGYGIVKCEGNHVVGREVCIGAHIVFSPAWPVIAGAVVAEKFK